MKQLLEKLHFEFPHASIFPSLNISWLGVVGKILWRFLFSRIWTKYGEILRISSHSVRMPENTDQKNSEHGHILCSVLHSCSSK